MWTLNTSLDRPGTILASDTEGANDPMCKNIIQTINKLFRIHSAALGHKKQNNRICNQHGEVLD